MAVFLKKAYAPQHMMPEHFAWQDGDGLKDMPPGTYSTVTLSGNGPRITVVAAPAGAFRWGLAGFALFHGTASSGCQEFESGWARSIA